jgi:hypothetical protein
MPSGVNSNSKLGKRSTLNAQFRSGFFVLVLMLVIVLKIHNHELDLFRQK